MFHLGSLNLIKDSNPFSKTSHLFWEQRMLFLQPKNNMPWKLTYKYAMPEHKFIEKVKDPAKCKMCLKYFHVRKDRNHRFHLVSNETFYYVFQTVDLRVIDSLLKPHHPVRCPFIREQWVSYYDLQLSDQQSEVWRQSVICPVSHNLVHRRTVQFHYILIPLVNLYFFSRLKLFLTCLIAFSGSLHLCERQACHKEGQAALLNLSALCRTEKWRWQKCHDCINSNTALMLIGLIFIILKVTFFLSAYYMFDTTLSS